jgi:hypothetical protein
MPEGRAPDAPRDAVQAMHTTSMDRVDMPRRLLRIAFAWLGVAGICHLAWILTARDAWIVAFRLLIGAFVLVYAAITVRLAVAARRYFRSTDPLRTVWSLLVAAAIVRLAGHVLTSGVAWTSPLPMADDVARVMRFSNIGELIAGPVYFAIVALAVGGVARVYRRLGLLTSLDLIDLVAVVGVSVFALRVLRDLVVWYATTPIRGGWLDAIAWARDPLLAILFLEAVLIHRSAVCMEAGYRSPLLGAILIRRSAAQLGAGYVAKCWCALVAGIFLSVLGDVGAWAAAHGFVHGAWTSLLWYVEPCADTAFALAPAWQIVACRAGRRYEQLPADALIVGPIGRESTDHSA